MGIFKIINSGSANNSIYNYSLNDCLNSGLGNNSVDAESFNETLYGGLFDDHLGNELGEDKDSSNSKKISLDLTKLYKLDELPVILHGINCPCCSEKRDNEDKDTDPFPNPDIPNASSASW